MARHPRPVAVGDKLTASIVPKNFKAVVEAERDPHAVVPEAQRRATHIVLILVEMWQQALKQLIGDGPAADHRAVCFAGTLCVQMIEGLHVRLGSSDDVLALHRRQQIMNGESVRCVIK